MNIDQQPNTLVFHTQQHTYKISNSKYPKDVAKSEIWMRSVNRHLSSLKVPKPERAALFRSLFGTRGEAQVWKKRYRKERKCSL